MRTAVLVLFLAACGAGAHNANEAYLLHHHGSGKNTTGTILGLARDHDTGDPVALAEIRLRGKGVDHVRTTSNDSGHYILDHVPPGTYQLIAEFAGQPLEVYDIEVTSGQTVYVDLVFTLGRPDPIHIDFGDPKQSMIDHYKPTHIGEQVARIEGTVNDIGTRERVSGAVVTAVTHGPAGQQTEMTVSGDDGRYEFTAVSPGTYNVSAYYSISGRGQIEVRRSDIAVAGAEAVFVPLWIEMTH